MGNGNYKVRVKHGNEEIEAEGDKEFVEKVINNWKNLLEKTPPVSETPPKEEERISSQTLKQFYKEKSPSNHSENIAVFAYYIKRYEKKDEFSREDINGCYTKAGERKPKDTSTAISDAARKYEYVKKAKGGFWRLTDHGENLVVHDLPRKKE